MSIVHAQAAQHICHGNTYLKWIPYPLKTGIAAEDTTPTSAIERFSCRACTIHLSELQDMAKEAQNSLWNKNQI